MKLPFIMSLLLLLTAGLTSAAQEATKSAPAAAGEEKPAVPKGVQYEENLKKDVQEEKELRQKMIDMINEMVIVMKDYDASSQSMNGISGLGRVEQLQFKAERYSAERQVRKRIEKDIVALSEVVQEWQTTQERVKEWTRLLDMEKRLLAIRNSNNSGSEKTAKGSSSLDMESVEYYTLKAAGSLKQISALPEVYGNENAWRYLYDANRDKVENPSTIIPAGTTLTVPGIKNKNKFVNLD